MAPTLSPNGNGRVRKTLASQIDRLDGILDGLSEALQEEISAGVQQAVKEAVKLAVVEVLTNEDLQRRIRVHPVATADVAQQPGIASRACLAISRFATWTVTSLAKAGRWVWSKAGSIATAAVDTTCERSSHAYHQALDLMDLSWSTMLAALLLALRYRKHLLVATTIGVTVGILCYAGGPIIATTTSVITSFLASFSTPLPPWDRIRRS